MRWQDIVISVAQLCFIIAMVPSIKSNDKPASSTSVMNIILVGVIAFCLLTLRLWFSALTALAIATTWAILAIQKIKLDKKGQ